MGSLAALKQDYASNHTSAVAEAAMTKAFGFKLVTYSPEVAPSNYRLFPKQKKKVHRKTYAVEQYIFPICSKNAINLMENVYINLKGDYIEK